MAAAIECHDLTRTYHTPGDTVVALDHVSLSVSVGELLVLHGASGSGKSTLLSMMAGLDSPDDGSVQVGEVVLSELPASARSRFRLQHLGVIFQDNNLIEEFTAVENVMLPLRGLGATASHAKQAAVESMARLGVEHLIDRRPREMSGGQRQRVGIARALVGERTLLLADEPTGALDSKNSTALFELIAALCHDGVTAVVATHDPLATRSADRVVELQDGRLVPQA